MIDKLPLEIFGDEPKPEVAPPVPPSAERSAPTTTVTRACQWCGKDVPVDGNVCPECGSRLIRVDSPPSNPRPGFCQWCSASIEPEADTCPNCGGSIGEATIEEIPGLTVPLSDSVIRSQVEREMREEADDYVAAGTLLIDVLYRLMKPGN